MHRIRSIVAALAGLALTAGVATGHLMPTASDQGLGTAREASGQSVPMGVDGSAADRDAQQGADTTEDSGSQTDASAPEGTHGADVSAAAQEPTPTDGSWANHGDYVSSVAKGWGQETSAANATAPSQAQNGLSHRP